MTDDTTHETTPDETTVEEVPTEAMTAASGDDLDTTPAEATTASRGDNVDTIPEEVPAEATTASSGDDVDTTPEGHDSPAPAADAAPPVAAPKPAIPSPAALAKRMAPRPTAPVPPPPALSESARFGRVAEDGTVFVLDGEEEHEVGSYPSGTPEEALQYFARKYDELHASAELLAARVGRPEVASKEIAEGLKHLVQQVAEAKVVGDLPGLRDRLAELEIAVTAKREQENQARAQAREAAAAEREVIVASAEKIAAQPEGSTQWKRSSEQMRALLDEWKQHQRTSVRLDKATETALWQRFSAARNSFDKARRNHFAHLDETRSEAKSTKERLVAQAEALASSRDWAPTARAFKNLMDQWRAAGRAARGDDDALWERFRAAQDAFFTAKDAVVAAEDEEYRANLAVKEALLVEAQALLPVTDLEATKASLRVLQDKWDKAGKVPRGDIERVEKAMRRVESAVREAEDRKWKASNPEVAARAGSMAAQLEASLSALRDDLTKARAKNSANKVAELESRIAAQEAWLAQARAGLDEFGSA